MRRPVIRRIVIVGGLILSGTATGCQNAPWRRDVVPPERPYVTAPIESSAIAPGAVDPSAPRIGFSSEPAQGNGYSASLLTPSSTSPEPTPGFGTSAATSPGSDPFSGIPGLPGPSDDHQPAGVMGTPNQPPSPL